jgi:hypothetical protein
VDVQIQVDGRVAPLYLAPGHFDRRYFQAFRGRNYSLVVRNNTGRRVGVLIAVDGLNVLNGEISNLSGQESMYVLDPYERAEIRGWRTSLDDVRRFVFVDEERSYAERSDKANGDMGWIRVLSFREQRTWWARTPIPAPAARVTTARTAGAPTRRRRRPPRTRSPVSRPRASAAVATRPARGPVGVTARTTR